MLLYYSHIVVLSSSCFDLTKQSMKLAVILIVICSVVQFSSAHFSLTYPIARYPDYDFLDNIRTGGPCGVPNGTWSALSAAPFRRPAVNIM